MNRSIRHRVYNGEGVIIEGWRGGGVKQKKKYNLWNIKKIKLNLTVFFSNFRVGYEFIALFIPSTFDKVPTNYQKKTV